MRSLGAKPLAQPAPVWVIGTYFEDDRPNMMTAAWGGICCSDPPCVQVSLRKATATYHNIMRNKAFTVNVPSTEFMEKSDYVGMVSGKDADKFKVTGLTPQKSDLVDAPYVAEFPLVLECSLIKPVEIGLHTLFIGEIKDVKVQEQFVDGSHADMAKIKPIIFAPGSRRYYTVGDQIGQAFSSGRACMRNGE
ncbi:flavin reductase family protein [Oceanidesulfovibrio marinus]|uniref:Flavin reductase family protein n=1 Tax=Oceanidesulfovibrio marinus TaxID=370038 RepID=A0A6P1ZL31_9BACT|nr:flavin reductase family protein [Oceanidesulfovibrio marinus]QJT10076.1 flavin reductase family protein [Oceanidesulfovibrio marinus]TVM35809.1 flavin reductase family protein [Oceanidesulfovibrio marinus]